MLPPPPRSTLFPYTTLFRSSSSRRARSRAPSRSSSAATHQASDEEDRKSTRLNSSHVSISYAVFCLKKKKYTKDKDKHCPTCTIRHALLPCFSSAQYSVTVL